MLADLIAGRYSKALFRAANAEKALAEVGFQADALWNALQGAEAAAFLGDPLAGADAKLEALASAFGGALHPVLRAFLAAVLSNKREPQLPAMLEAFARLCDEAEGRLRAGLGLAHALKPRELELLRTGLSKSLHREVILLPYTDPALLGGAVLKLGDTVYDGSVRGGLERLGRALLAEPRVKAAAAPASGAKPGKKQAAGKKAAATGKKPAVKAPAKTKSKVKAKSPAPAKVRSGAPKAKAAKKKAS